MEPIVDCDRDLLPATQITIGRFNRRMAQQELNLLQFAARFPALPGAGAPHIMCAEMLDADRLGRGDNDTRPGIRAFGGRRWPYRVRYRGTIYAERGSSRERRPDQQGRTAA